MKNTIQGEGVVGLRLEPSPQEEQVGLEGAGGGRGEKERKAGRKEVGLARGLDSYLVGFSL